MMEELKEDKSLNKQSESIKQSKKAKAFEILESYRKEVPELECDKELESYREQKYGRCNIS